MLIVFEGPEGVGKTTQLRLLAEWCTARGQEVVALREPGGTLLGDEIRRLLLDPKSDITREAEALLFMASRAQLVEQQIGPALQRGALVLLDRFFLSTYAYQCAGRGLPEKEVRDANTFATAGLRPDVTLLFWLPVTDAFARVSLRGEHDRMERADREFHDRVAQQFLEFGTDAWQVVDSPGASVVASQLIWFAAILLSAIAIEESETSPVFVTVYV